MRNQNDTPKMTLQEYHALTKKRPSKYGNIKTQVDGIWFDSKKEANRYGELKLLQCGKIIKNLKTHPRYLVGPKIIYEADFEYYDNEKNVTIVEDVKSSLTFKTNVYKIKKKLFLEKYGKKYTFLESY